MTLNKAIKIIAWYCMKHGCDNCRLYTSDGCFKNAAPCDWPELMSEKDEEE